MIEENAFDLRLYVGLLIDSWRLILATTLVAGLAAFGLAASSSEKYEASSTVVAPRPLYTFQFEPRIETSSDAKTVFAGYSELAVSDDVLQGVLSQLAPVPKYVLTVADLRQSMKVKAAADSGSLQLIVRTPEPGVAVRIANLWAEQFVACTNPTRPDRLSFLQNEAQQARLNLAQAEQASIDYAAQNRAEILETQLSALKQDILDYHAIASELLHVLDRAVALRVRLASQPANSQARSEDTLAVLVLQIESRTGCSPRMPGRQSLQLEVSTGDMPLATRTVGSLTDALDEVTSSIETQLQTMSRRSADLEPQMLDLQQRLLKEQVEEERLTSARDEAEQTYTALMRKVDETRIAAADASGQVRLSRRATWASRVGSGRLPLTATGAVFGLVMGALAAVTMEWWRSGTRYQPKDLDVQPPEKA